MNYIISFVTGYLLGSIPTAYLIIKRSKGLDIRNAGSTNVGAKNAYDVSNSRSLGFLVLGIDFLKGLAAVFIIRSIFPDSFILPMITLIAAVLSHCYNPWLSFKGGKGLATTAGGAVLLLPVLLLLWLLFWIVAYIFKRNILFGNITATILSWAIYITSDDILNKYSLPPAESLTTLKITISILLIIILSRHYDSLIELFSGNFFKRRKN